MDILVTIICKKDETEEVKRIITEKNLRLIKSDETKADLNFYTFKPNNMGAELLMAFEG
jgi:hypothetical protein